MTTCYYGDGVSAVTGNWNTVANWYSTLGSACPCSPSSGTPLGRLPGVGDTVVLVGNATPPGVGSILAITTGPANFSGPVSWLGGGNVVPQFPVQIGAGAFSGTVNINLSPTGIGGLGTGNWNGISGGTYTGTVQLSAYAGFSPATFVAIKGGTFTGTVTRANPNGTNINEISGGTYKPTAALVLTNGVITGGAIPADPGFAEGGGTFAPQLTFTGSAQGNVYPPPASVLPTQVYGPHGNDFTGTLVYAALVPNVVGLFWRDAQLKLLAAGLSIANPTFEHSTNTIGMVNRQAPPAGTYLIELGVVSLFVSNGQSGNISP